MFESLVLYLFKLLIFRQLFQIEVDDFVTYCAHEDVSIFSHEDIIVVVIHDWRQFTIQHFLNGIWRSIIILSELINHILSHFSSEGFVAVKISLYLDLLRKRQKPVPNLFSYAFSVIPVEEDKPDLISFRLHLPKAVSIPRKEGGRHLGEVLLKYYLLLGDLLLDKQFILELGLLESGYTA